MAKTKILQVRVTNEQYKLIAINRDSKGYSNTSEFIRDLALNSGFSLSAERKLTEIYNFLCSKNSEPQLIHPKSLKKPNPTSYISSESDHSPKNPSENLN